MTALLAAPHPLDLTIGHCGPEDAPEWDAFVRRAQGATFCHLAAWGEVIAEVMGHPPLFLAARSEQGEMRGVLPMVQVRSRVFGSRLVSMPFLNYGGPLGDATAQALLVEQAVAEAERLKVGRLELRARHPVAAALTPTYGKVTVLLPLVANPEELWASLKAKVRSQIRRPMKEGMETRVGRDQLEPFHDVFSRNMRDLGTPVLPRKFFERMAESFPREVVFAAVYDGPRAVAAGAGFVFGDEFEITWASSLREYSRSAPNMLLYWSLMEEMGRRGVRTFNFGRCTPGEGTHRFKLQWGGHDQPLPWLTWPAQSGTDPKRPGRLTRLLSRAWQRLPVPVANAAGPLVARELPWW